MACSAAVYDDVLREALLLLKFGRRDILAPPLAELMADFARERLPVDQFDWAVPVPLHPLRQRERGFNQSELLAREFSEAMDGPQVVNALVKPEPTEPQTRLDGTQRRKNLRGSFKIAPDIDPAGRSILIIDDVFTTGTTANECAHVLKRAGARSVAAFTLARRVASPSRLS
jgi:ComF family protein